MSIAIQYDASFGGSYNGLDGYLAHYQSTFYSPGHAANMSFDGGSTLELGYTTSAGPGQNITYNKVAYGQDMIGEYLYDGDYASDGADFMIRANEVTLEKGTGASTSTTYQSANMLYTAGTAPSHTLAGEIAELAFGDGTGAANPFDALFTITDLTQHIGNGFEDNGGISGAYDAIINRTTGNNNIHNLVLELMGGSTGGVGGTGVLRGFFDTYGTTQTGAASDIDEIFSSFGGNDTFTGDGGNDTFRFREEFGNDEVTDFTNSSGSAGDRDTLAFDEGIFATDTGAYVIANHYYVDGNGNGVVGYMDGNSVVHTVTVSGTLTAADIDFFA